MDTNIERIDGLVSESRLGVDWLQKSFQVKNSVTSQGVDLDVLFARIYTSAMMKFTDTTPGGNFSLNPLPQASLWTDPPPLRGKSTDQSSYRVSSAQGGFYSEAFDDNQQVVYFRFGVPAFNSLTGFYSRFYNSQYARLARTGGAGGGLLYELGNGIGKVVGSPLGIAAFAFNTIGGLIRWIPDAFNYLTRKTSSLYYFKSAMPLYWGAAQGILNHIAVNKGFLSPISEDQDNMPSEGMRSWPRGEDVASLAKLYPDIVTESGNINLFGIASRAQRMFNDVYKEVSKLGGDRKSVRTKLVQMYKNDMISRLKDNHTVNNARSINDIQADWFKQQGAGALSGDGTMDGTNDEDSLITNTAVGMGKMVESGINDGYEFVGFRVNNTGGVQESFSNSFRESELGQWINSQSASSRSTKFSLNNGNISDFPLMDVVEGVVAGISEQVSSLADSLGVGGIPGVLMGNAYVDIPRFWDRADVSFPSKSYTIDLISPYGDVYSQIVNLYAPLSCLLAGAMVRSTGRNSYTEPFLCQVFDKGRAQTRLGMIKSLSVQRGGSGNVAWTNDQEPLHIRVTVEVEDMESVMHMPLVEKFGSGSLAVLENAAAKLLNKDVQAVFEGGWFSLDTPFTDYMAVLGSLDLTAQIYHTEDIKRKWRVNHATVEVRKSDAYGAMAVSSSIFGRVANIFAAGTFQRSNGNK